MTLGSEAFLLCDTATHAAWSLLYLCDTAIVTTLACVTQDIMGVVPLVKHAFAPLSADITELLKMSEMHLAEKNFGVRRPLPLPLPLPLSQVALLRLLLWCRVSAKGVVETSRSV